MPAKCGIIYLFQKCRAFLLKLLLYLGVFTRRVATNVAAARWGRAGSFFAYTDQSGVFLVSCSLRKGCTYFWVFAIMHPRTRDHSMKQLGELPLENSKNACRLVCRPFSSVAEVSPKCQLHKRKIPPVDQKTLLLSGR